MCRWELVPVDGADGQPSRYWKVVVQVEPNQKSARMKLYVNNDNNSIQPPPEASSEPIHEVDYQGEDNRIGWLAMLAICGLAVALCVGAGMLVAYCKGNRAGKQRNPPLAAKASSKVLPDEGRGFGSMAHLRPHTLEQQNSRGVLVGVGARPRGTLPPLQHTPSPSKPASDAYRLDPAKRGKFAAQPVPFWMQGSNTSSVASPGAVVVPVRQDFDGDSGLSPTLRSQWTKHD